MRDELTCLVHGRVVGLDKEPRPGREVEFLPTQWFFVSNGVTLASLGASAVTDEDGCFTVRLTRSDLTHVHYLTRGAIGNYLISLNGPGPHLMSKLQKAGRRVTLQERNS